MAKNANVTRASIGGVDEVRNVATRHEHRARKVDWKVAVTIAGNIVEAEDGE